jgi:DNA-binding NarL/FixJ family response regulator
VPVLEKLKREMKYDGIKGIPRGLRQTTSENPAKLTGREMDVLQLIKEGIRNKEIASRLFISPKTVDNHITSILFKLDVNSRGKAAQKAIELHM